MRWWKSKPPLTVRAGACTDVGQVRDRNQDNYGRYVHANGRGGEEHLFVMADGMGGHEHGETASRLAVEEVRQTFFATDGPVGARLRRALEAANARIFAKAHADGASHGRTMGTTCTALVVAGGAATLAHVGDSRAYRVADDGIEQLTDDHTVADELRRGGLLTADEALRHPQRHALTRALGTQPAVDVDVLPARPLRPPETYVLCSDGLAPVADDEIQRVVGEHAPQEASERLVQLANDRGGPDNVSVLVVAVG